MYTKCPQCQTTFGITVDQLEARDGAVRCGRCMEVFNARWNLVDAMVQAEPALDIPEPVEPTPPSPGARAASAAEAAPARTRPAVSAPGSLSTESVRHRSPGLKQRPESPTAAPLASALDDVKPEKPTSPPSDVSDSTLDRPVDAPSPEKRQLRDAPSKLLDKALLDKAPPPVRDATSTKISQPEMMQNADLAKAFGRGSIERGKRTAALVIPQADTASPESRKGPRHEPPIPSDFPEKTKLVEPAVSPPVEASAAKSPPSVTNVSEQESKLDRNQFDGLARPEPGSAGARRIPVAAWAVGSALMVAVLVAQARFFYLDDLAQSPQARPVAEVLCRLTDCSLPDRKLTEQFRVVATDIRFHPVAPAAVRISTRILNTAAVEQPLPDIQLTLTDKLGKVVGRRTFKPVHYMGQGFNPRDRIFPEVVKQINLDLMSPHADAIGFEVELVHRIESNDRRRG